MRKFGLSIVSIVSLAALLASWALPDFSSYSASPQLDGGHPPAFRYPDLAPVEAPQSREPRTPQAASRFRSHPTPHQSAKSNS